MQTKDDTKINDILHLFSFEAEKKEKFLEFWSVIKSAMEEKLKYQSSLNEILLRCCAFLTFLYYSKELEAELQSNHMEKFMMVEASKNEPNGLNSNVLFDVKNLKNQSRLLNLHDFFKFLKKIIRPNFEQNTDFYLSNEIINDFSFSDTLYGKCEEFLNLFFDNHSPYYQNIKKLIWTCYIYSKANLINRSRNIIECLPMLIAIFSLFLMDVDDQRFKRSFVKMIDDEVKQMTDENYQTSFRAKKKEFIISFLYKKAGGRINEIPKLNTEIIKNLRELKEIREHLLPEGNEKLFDLTSDCAITAMIECFKTEYAKYLRFKNFDERIFLMEKDQSDCSPVKLTPFRRQKISNLQNFEIKKPAAYKTLDFNDLKKPMDVSGENHMNFNNFKPNNSFRGLDIKELSQKLNSTVDMTPCTKVMFMDKWIEEYIKDTNFDKLTQLESLCKTYCEYAIEITPYLDANLQKIQALFSQYRVRVVNTVDKIKTLALKIICGLLKRDEKKFRTDFISRVLSNQNFLKSALMVSVEIVLFIENVEEICFYRLAEELKLDLYEFWKIINPFLNFDLTIPSDIRLHFNEIELQLMSFMIWKKPSIKFKEELSEFLNKYTIFLYDKDLKEIEDIEFNNQSLFVYQDQSIFQQDNLAEMISPSSTTENSSNSMYQAGNLINYRNIKPVYIFLRRILNYAIFLNKKITDNLHLNKETAKECEDLIKRILMDKEYLEVLYNRHIDQIIFCSIMSVMKLRGFYTDLKSILDAYHRSKPDDSESLTKSLFMNIKLDKKSIGIEEFHEEIFSKKIDVLMRSLFEEEEIVIRKKRKFSVPDTEIRKIQFEDETAFENATIMYEPLSKTIFNKNRVIKMESPYRNTYSVRCSPMMRYQSPNVMHRTPRTVRVRDAYADYTGSEILVLSNQTPSVISSGSANNQYKIKLKNYVSGGKQNSQGFPKFQLNDLEGNNINNSLLSDANDNLSLKLDNSQSTPEFNKTKK